MSVDCSVVVWKREVVMRGDKEKKKKKKNKKMWRSMAFIIEPWCSHAFAVSAPNFPAPWEWHAPKKKKEREAFQSALPERPFTRLFLFEYIIVHHVLDSSYDIMRQLHTGCI